MSAGGDFGNPLRKFKLVFLGEQSGEYSVYSRLGAECFPHAAHSVTPLGTLPAPAHQGPSTPGRRRKGMQMGKWGRLGWGRAGEDPG